MRTAREAASATRSRGFITELMVTSHLKTHKTGIEFNGGVLGGIRR